MKRRKPIDEQGHVPMPHASGKGVECKNCHNVRLKDQPWRHACTQQKRAEQVFMGGEAA